jgi:hypothetical protein
VIWRGDERILRAICRGEKFWHAILRRAGTHGAEERGRRSAVDPNEDGGAAQGIQPSNVQALSAGFISFHKLGNRAERMSW